jgi:hypothetical protein
MALVTKRALLDLHTSFVVPLLVPLVEAEPAAPWLAHDRSMDPLTALITGGASGGRLTVRRLRGVVIRERRVVRSA